MAHLQMPPNGPSTVDLNKMNADENGKQPEYGYTTYQGPQGPIVQHVGRKGLRKILEERGADMSQVKNKADLIDALRKFSDFASPPPPMVESFVLARGHRVVWIPKYHCELNPIELVWGMAKRLYRRHALGSMPNMRALVPRVLAAVDLHTIRRFARRCRDFARAYRNEGESRIRSAQQLEAGRKVYKSHRRVFLSTLQRELNVPERADDVLPEAPALLIENDGPEDDDDESDEE